MARDIFDFSVFTGMKRLMSLNGCHAAIMRTEKIKGESVQGLPPGKPIPVMPVDCLKERPAFWIGGQGAYVCPVQEDWALWFNWDMNRRDTMAVLASVKGMNPITGQRMAGFGLEQYQSKCPVHDEPFKDGLFCEKCGFRWPQDNFYASPNPLYCDGFRTPDGSVRQFYFTAEMVKSIPELVIGKEDTVPAFGFCFFKPESERPYYAATGATLVDIWPEDMLPAMTLSNHSGGLIPDILPLGGGGTSSIMYCASVSSSSYTASWGGRRDELKISASSDDEPIRAMGLGDAVRERSYRSAGLISHISDGDMDSGEEKTTGGIIVPMRKMSKSAEVGIGAGAKIKQTMKKSARSLSEWKTKPEAVMRVYFVFVEEFERMVAAGLNDLQGSREGYLEDLPVGGAK